MYSIIFFPYPEDCRVVLLNSAFPPRVRKSLKPGWEGGAQLLCAIKGLRYFSTLRFSKTVRLIAVALLHLLPPSFCLRHLFLFTPDHTKGLFASFPVDLVLIPRCQLSFSFLWGGLVAETVELVPNCEVFAPTVFLHSLEGEFFSMCVFWTVGTVFKGFFPLNPVFLTHKTCSQNLCFSYLAFLTVTPWCIPFDLLKAWS